MLVGKFRKDLPSDFTGHCFGVPIHLALGNDWQNRITGLCLS